MIGRQYQGGSVDEVAVRRDDELLELLGGRSALRDTDAAGSLLWALTLDVDREEVPVASESVPVAMVGERRETTSHGARGTVIGVVVAATLSISGVAAAVTGDPLSPYRAVLSLAQDDDPPAPRRSAGPDPVRRQAPTTGQTGGLLAGPDVALGRVAVGDAQVPGRGANTPRTDEASKPTKEQQRSGRSDGTTGKPESPGRSADRAERATAATEAKAVKAAKDAKEAQAAQRAEEAKDAGVLDRPETVPQPQRARAARPETKEERDKP